MASAIGEAADIPCDRPDIDAKTNDQLIATHLSTLATSSRSAGSSLPTVSAHHQLTDDHASALAANRQLTVDLDKERVSVKWMLAKLRSLAQTATGDGSPALQENRACRENQLEAEFEKYIERIEGHLKELENDSRLLRHLAGLGVSSVGMPSQDLNVRGQNPHHDVAPSRAEETSLLLRMAKQIGGDATKLAEAYLDKHLNYSADQLELFERSHVMTPIQPAMVPSIDQADIANVVVKDHVEAQAAVQQDVLSQNGRSGDGAEVMNDDTDLKPKDLSQITEYEPRTRAEASRARDSPRPGDPDVTAPELSRVVHTDTVLKEGKGLQQRFEKVLRNHHDTQKLQYRGFAAGKTVSSDDRGQKDAVTDKLRETNDDKAIYAGQKFKGRNLVPVVFKYGFSTTIVKAPRGALVERFGQKKIAGEDENNKESSNFLDANVSTSHALKDLNKLSAHQALQDSLELSTSEQKIADSKEDDKVLQSSVFLNNNDTHPQSQELLNVHTDFTHPTLADSLAEPILREDLERLVLIGTQMAPRNPRNAEDHDWSHTNGHDVTDQRRAVHAYRATRHANSSGTANINQGMNTAQPSQATSQVSAATQRNLQVAQLMGHSPVHIPSHPVTGVQQGNQATSQTVSRAQRGRPATQAVNPYIAMLNQRLPPSSINQAIAQAFTFNPPAQTAPQVTPSPAVIAATQVAQALTQSHRSQGITSQVSTSTQAVTGARRDLPTSQGVSPYMASFINNPRAINNSTQSAQGTTQTPSAVQPRQTATQSINAAPQGITPQAGISAQVAALTQAAQALARSQPVTSQSSTSTPTDVAAQAPQTLNRYQDVSPSPYMASLFYNPQVTSNVHPARATTQAPGTFHRRQTVTQATNAAPRGITSQTSISTQATQALNQSQVVSPYMASFTLNPQAATNVQPAQATTQALGISRPGQMSTQETNSIPNRNASQTSNTTQAASAAQTMNSSQDVNTQQGGGYIARMINNLRAGNEFRPGHTAPSTNTPEASNTAQLSPSAPQGNDSDAGNNTQAVNIGETGETQTTDNAASIMNVNAPVPLFNPHPVVNNLPRPVGYAMPTIVHNVVQGPQSVLTAPPTPGFALNPRDDSERLRAAQVSAAAVNATINWRIPPGYTGIQPGQESNNLVRATETPLFLEEGLRYQPGPAARSVHRTVLIRGIPDNSNASTITAAIQGGNVELIELERLGAIMGPLHPGRSLVARVVFFKETGALECERYARVHGIIVNGVRTDVRVVETPTYPRSDEVDALIYHQQATRVLVINAINDREGIDLLVDGETGVVRPVRNGDDNEMTVELRSVRAAARLAAAIAASEFGEVEFGPDPCNGA